MASHTLDDGSSWTLQIKTVGDGVRDFTVELHPNDDLSQLYDEIHDVTGLRREQQRLIYRGRLLANGGDSEGPKVKDIRGLTDGHTIHLVRKQERKAEDETSANPTPVPTTNESGPPNASPVRSQQPSSSLLAALLGSERNRRVPFRLREEDLERPDPGSLESVRQGLMTMHTMIPGRGAPRRFYVGQWVDCRDTVNQWLESTVVAILEPAEIRRRFCVREDRPQSAVGPTYDPAVSATDLEGRRRLLLESCEAAESEEQIDGVHYRSRSNNENVQLLHIHYNGWPIRWDEWIRSDSERLRTFRVRTRHANSNQRSSPAIQASMSSPPNTKLTDSEAADREAILPELLVALNSVQDLLQHAAAQTRQQPLHSEHLPWQGREESEDQPRGTRRMRQRELESLAPLLDRLGRSLTDYAPHVAALASTLGEREVDANQLETIEEHPSTLGGLLSLLSRDRRPRNGQSVSSTVGAIQNNDVSVSVASSTTGGNDGVLEDEDEVGDPDLTDYASGIVNTTRGEVRSGPRSTSRSGNGEDASNILGAYLAAASLAGADSNGDAEGGMEDNLGRLLRERGTGGIDIHIHAVVTAPGFEGGIGVTTAGAGALPAILSQDQSPRRRGRPPAVTTIPPLPEPDEDDDGIFSDLYSENPEPLDPTTPPGAIRDEPSSSNSNSESTEQSRGSSTGSSRASRRNGVLRFFRRAPETD